MADDARAILLLPSGHRAFDEDFAVPLPPPRLIYVAGEHGSFHRIHTHRGALVDDVTRALYVLGGHYRPHGSTRQHRLDPDEAHDQ